MKALLLYHSKTGTTANYAEKIKLYLIEKGIDSEMSSIKYFNDSMLENVDFVFLGCWTSGLFFFLQHPEKEWIEFAKKLNINKNTKIALFTTYKLLTGSMFKNMKIHIKGDVQISSVQLKSKYGELSEVDKSELDKFVN